MVTTERLRELIDAAPAAPLEAATGQTYGASPSTEAFVRCIGDDTAVAETTPANQNQTPSSPSGDALKRVLPHPL